MKSIKIFCIVLISICSLLIIMATFPLGYWLFMCSYDLNSVKYYADDENYTTFECTVESFVVEEDYISITFKHSQKDFYDKFKIVGKSIDLAINNGLLSVLQKDEIFTITSADKYLGDGWAYPIVELVYKDNTIIPYETGKTNYLEVQQEAEDFSKLYITILGSIIGVLAVIDAVSIVGLYLLS